MLKFPRFLYLFLSPGVLCDSTSLSSSAVSSSLLRELVWEYQGFNGEVFQVCIEK